MVVIALCFDLLQLGAGIFILAGSLGAAAVGWIPILGQILGGVALWGGAMLQWTFAYMIMVLGYCAMGFWFIHREVPLFGGKKVAGRVATFFLALLADFMPYLNAIIPGLTVWTIVMLYHARREDKEKTAAAEEYNETNSTRVARDYVRTTA
jgi:hypothetical protein